MAAMSKHFHMASPLNVVKGGSDVSAHLRHQSVPKMRKEVFFRSGNNQNLHKMTLNESQSGEILGVTDFRTTNKTNNYL